MSGFEDFEEKNRDAEFGMSGSVLPSREKFGEWWNQFYEKQVFARLFWGYELSWHSAQECAHEICINVFTRCYNGGPPIMCPRAFIYKCARNEALKCKEKEGKLFEGAGSSLLDVCDAPVPDNTPSSEEKAQRSEAREKLEGAIEKLPNWQRELVRLHYFELLTYSEIAKVVGIEEGTVSAGLFAAKLRLRESLSRFEI